jgi:hypothetical protein
MSEAVCLVWTSIRDPNTRGVHDNDDVGRDGEFPVGSLSLALGVPAELVPGAGQCSVLGGTLNLRSG